MGQVDDQLDDFTVGACRPLVEVGGEGSIDLELVDRQFLQVRQT